MEVEVKNNQLDIHIKATKQELNEIIESINKVYTIAMLSGTMLPPDFPLWTLKNQLVLARNNAE